MKTDATVFSGINKQTTLFVVITQGVMMTWSIASSYLQSGSKSAFIITTSSFIVYVGYALYSRNMLFIKLLLFGLMAGILELWADHYSVTTIKTLVYPSGDPMIISSPLYMPLSWAIALTQLGYYSLLLIRWKNLTVASIIMALSGGMYIPMYENLAKNAGWWYYQSCSMLSNAPYYIIICEILISATLPFLIYLSIKRKWKWAIVLGILEGVWILISAMIAFFIAP